MTLSQDMSTILRRALASLTDPRGAARWVMSAEMSRGARWLALLAASIVSVLLAQVGLFVALSQGQLLIGPHATSPLLAVVLQTSILVITVFLIYWIGHAMGGGGGFGNTILLVAWLQVVLSVVQVVQVAAMLFSPGFANVIGIAGVGLSMWLLTVFIAELHGFASLAKVFAMILATLFGIGIGLSILLAFVGVTAPQGF